MRRPFQMMVVWLGLWAAFGSAAAEGPSAAGTVIVNQAFASYEDMLSGVHTTESNAVTTTVASVCSVSVLSGAAQSYQPGSPLVFPFSVINTGNDQYTLNLQGKLTPKLNVQLYRDAAPLGVKDAGDVLLSPEQLNLAAGQTQALLLEVSVPSGTSGELSAELSAACPNGGQAATGQQSARPAAKLVLMKTFSAASLQPGGDVTVTLRVFNAGEFDASNVVVEDLLEQSLNAGHANFELVDGSPAPQLGYEPVTGGVRWRVPLLARQQALTFSFALRALPGAEVGQKTNLAVAQGQNSQGRALAPAEAQAQINLLPPPQIALGPAGNAQALTGGEGSSSDRQDMADVMENQEVCMAHALQNLGPFTDDLSVALESGIDTAQFRTMSGAAQVFPVKLAPQQTAAFLVCYPVGTQPFEVRLKATSAAQARPNMTTDAVTSVMVPGVALGPLNSPEAPELTEADTQTQPSVFAGEEICFEHTLKNTGTHADSYTLSAAAAQGAATSEFEIAQPVALAAGASVNFKVCYTAWQSGPLEMLLTATSKYGPTNRTRDRVLDVVQPLIALGPIGNPQANPGGEGSQDDVQVRDNALLGQRLCFSQTVSNLAKVPDEIRLSAAVDLGRAEPVLETLDGRPLAQPVKLAAAGEGGDHADFRICFTPQEAAAGELALQVVIKADSALGAPSNFTRDQVRRLYSGLPRLTKTVDHAADLPVAQGQALSYTLKIENPFPFTLTGVTVQDLLSEYLDPASTQLSDGGVLSARTVTWTLGDLAPGSVRTLSVKANVRSNAPDGVQVVNRFAFTSSEVTVPAPSNEVSTLIWSAALTLNKRADAAQVDIGGELGWTLQIHNTSVSAALGQLLLTDTLPTGLSFVPGSARLDGQALPNPQIDAQVLRFTLPQPIKAGATMSLNFRTRVGVNSPEVMINSAQVSGQGPAPLSAVASNIAHSQTVRVNPRVFAPRGELLGRGIPRPQRQRRFRVRSGRAAGQRPPDPGRRPQRPERQGRPLPFPGPAGRHVGRAPRSGLGAVRAGARRKRRRPAGQPQHERLRADGGRLPLGKAAGQCLGQPDHHPAGGQRHAGKVRAPDRSADLRGDPGAEHALGPQRPAPARPAAAPEPLA